VPKLSEKSLSAKEKEEIIKQAMEDYDLASTAESRNRIDQIDDLRFAALDQWPDEVAKERKGRPMLTLDHVGQAVRKVVGSIRQNMPSIKVDPIDDGADKETSDVLEDLTRQIEQQSNARNAYIRAANTQVKCGYGVWRINTVVNDDDIFEQDIVVTPVKNPFSWYFDPDAIKPQRQDGRFAINSEVIPLKEYEAKYGNKEKPSSFPSTGLGNQNERWYAHDSVRVAEYFVKRKKKKQITQLSNGVVVNSDEVTEEDIQLYSQQGIFPAKTREVESDVIDYYKLTAFNVIEHKEWPGKYFPAIPVYGEEDDIEGETRVRGIVRAAKDPQRMYNYWNSASAETIALQPKAPYLVTKNQIKNSKAFWDRANVDNLPYLPYEPDGSAPPPQRIAPPAMQAGLLQQSAVSAQDIQQATGVFEASTGALPEQRSGIAVQALQREADLGSSIYMDNLAVAIEHTGRVILDLIPKYYDTQRIVRLRGEDDAVRFVEVNKPILTPDGVKIQNDLTRGKYDVRVGVGPSYRTRRIEAANSMVELSRVFPQILQVAGDLVAKNLDWPGADEMAERLKKMLPPGMADENDEDKDPAQLQAEQQAQQMAQAQAQLQMEGVTAKIALDKAKAAETLSKVEKNDADSAKSLTEAEKNQIENAVQIAELANQQQNQQLMAQALGEITQLLRNEQQPLPAAQNLPVGALG
jgi:hypothetical protein